MIFLVPYGRGRRHRLLGRERFAALPNHEGGDANVDGNRDDADDEIDVSRALQQLNQLCANFRASNGAEGHDESATKIDIAKGAMLSHGHDRFADNVRKIGADGEVPTQPDCAKGRAGNETSTNTEKAAQNPDDESNDHEINWADVRVGDRKKHNLFRAAANQPQQKRRHILENNE